ncbi:hypothetical protein [Campylobacter sp. RM12651]|uniref:hypothetical protein n=1 Tax=Campylobacter sp. RM12651 TaxID=1660079 RepID=UPI001EFBCB1F|nr:hypothetical protein [Campylobacter sp. RM12651]ULO03742.1 hypothetical protein AVBRAN_1287 [Campylobacter sp. RM12651]
MAQVKINKKAAKVAKIIKLTNGVELIPFGNIDGGIENIEKYFNKNTKSNSLTDERFINTTEDFFKPEVDLYKIKDNNNELFNNIVVMPFGSGNKYKFAFCEGLGLNRKIKTIFELFKDGFKYNSIFYSELEDILAKTKLLAEPNTYGLVMDLEETIAIANRSDSYDNFLDKVAERLDESNYANIEFDIDNLKKEVVEKLQKTYELSEEDIEFIEEYVLENAEHIGIQKYQVAEVLSYQNLNYEDIFTGIPNKENAEFLKNDYCSSELDLELLRLIVSKTKPERFVEQMKLLAEYGLGLGEFEFEELYKDYCFDSTIHKNISLHDAKEIILYEKYVRNSLEWYGCGETKDFFLLSDCLSEKEKDQIRSM